MIDEAKKRLTYLRYQRRRYKKNGDFKKKITEINKEAREDAQRETKDRANNAATPWIDTEIEELKRLTRTMTTKEVAIRLGRTYDAVRKQRERLGIRKTKKWKNEY